MINYSYGVRGPERRFKAVWRKTRSYWLGALGTALALLYVAQVGS